MPHARLAIDFEKEIKVSYLRITFLLKVRNNRLSHQFGISHHV